VVKIGIFYVSRKSRYDRPLETKLSLYRRFVQNSGINLTAKDAVVAFTMAFGGYLPSESEKENF
jgi:hypothetical protein